MKVRASFPRKMMMFSTTGSREMAISSHYVIEEAVFNILHNAVKVQNRTDPVVQLEVVDEGPFVSVMISDHGPGLSDGRKAQLFDRDGNGLKIRFTGIGLTIVKRLMDAFGDGLEVLDRIPEDPSKGLTFRLRFKKYIEEVQ
jgi:signal transduction histidine kinase